MSSAQITGVDALEVLDSRGHPTVRARVTLSDGSRGEAAVPSGASTGRFEAHELRDGDPARYGGRGVTRAVGHVRGELARAVLGRQAVDQAGVDAALLAADGSQDKSRLGANALLALSLANARAAALAQGLPLFTWIARLSGGEARPALPLPMINLFSGGKHAGAQVDFQDFLIVPRGADTLAGALAMTHRVVYAALDLLREELGYQGLVADEGGWAPALPSNEAMLEMACWAIERAGLRPLEDVALAVDVAASHFFRDGAYHLRVENRALDAGEMVERLVAWRGRYPILSFEDGLAEDDWPAWESLQARLGDRCQILGDDLLVTDVGRIARAVERRAANSVLIKVNQVGTLSEAMQALTAARQAGWTAVVSARSGETEDDWLADLAVGSGAGQIKVGAITRSERLAKYNRLLAIEHDHGDLPYARQVLDRFIA